MGDHEALRNAVKRVINNMKTILKTRKISILYLMIPIKINLSIPSTMGIMTMMIITMTMKTPIIMKRHLMIMFPAISHSTIKDIDTSKRSEVHLIRILKTLIKKIPSEKYLHLKWLLLLKAKIKMVILPTIPTKRKVLSSNWLRSRTEQ